MSRNAGTLPLGPLRAGAPTTRKQILLRLAKILLAGLGVLIAAVVFTRGLTEGNLLQLIGGFLATAAGGGILAALVLPMLRQQTREWVPAVAGLVIAIGLSVFLAIAGRVEVGSSCDGEGVATAAAYDGGPGPHPVEAVRNGRRIWAPPSQGWRPTSTEETELVACVGGLEQYVIQTCQYTGAAAVTRYGYRRDVTLVAARTGEVLASASFKGAAPRQCGKTEDRSVRSIKGEKEVDPEDIWNWLSAWVVAGEGQAPVLDAGGPEPQISPEPTQEAGAVAGPEPTAVEPVEEPKPVVDIGPEPTRIDAKAPEETPLAIVTPGSQPPETAVLTGSPSLWSGPDHQGEHMGIILKEGESVEILATTKEWTQVRWVSPEGKEVIGWALSEFVGRQ